MKTVTYKYNDIKQAIELLNTVQVQGMKNMQVILSIGGYLDTQGEISGEDDAETASAGEGGKDDNPNN